MTNSEILTEILDSYEKSNDAFKRSKVDGDMQILEVIFKAMNRVKNNVDLAEVVGQSEQLVCECGNKLTDKEMYFGQCLQCDKSVEEAN